MTFEEGLKVELSSIPDLKVYPIVAPEDSKAPFIVYRKTNRIFHKTMDGIMLNRAEATYCLTLIAPRYQMLQSKSDSIILLLSGLLNKSIATTGPMVTNISIESNEDQYEPELEWFRSDIVFKVNYQ
jgi:hypothetical protein